MKESIQRKDATADAVEVIAKKVITSPVDQYFPGIIELEEQCSKTRTKTKDQIIMNYNINQFVPEAGVPPQNQTLIHILLYGAESNLLGTGLRYNQLVYVFKHDLFEYIIKNMIPEIERKTQWNLKDENEFKKFCSQLFSYNVKYYKETIPIRLASYFYPESIFPIFKIEVLCQISAIFGFESNNNTRADLLFDYNKFLLNKTKELNVNNSIKTYYLYQVKTTVEILEKIRANVSRNEIEQGYRQNWARTMFDNGITILNDLKLI
jgi:hypothetical protein